MLKSSMHSCQITYENNCDHKENNNIKDLQEAFCDLKVMLEMQAIINQGDEEKLKQINEENNNLIDEKNYYIRKLSEKEIEVEDKTVMMKELNAKIIELEEMLKEEKKNLDDEREKVEWLTNDNKNLRQTLEKKVHKLKKLQSQLDDERTFYAQEKSRYCKEMKRPRNHTTEVQTDNSVVDDESVFTQKFGNESNEIKQLKALYKHQLITTCLICEKYIKLKRHKNVLLRRLSHTRKEYKKAMCDIMLEFDTCRAEYTALLEDNSNEDNQNNLLKIVNRSNRLASDNAVLKQELLHLNNCLCLFKSFHNLKDDVTISIINQNGQFSHDDDDKNNQFHNQNILKKKKRKRRKNKTITTNKNILDINQNYYSSGPASSLNDSTDSYEAKGCFKKSKYRRKRVAIRNNGRLISYSSNDMLTDSSDLNIIQNYNRVNICPSFMSFSSDNTDKEINKNYLDDKSNKEIERNKSKKHKFTDRGTSKIVNDSNKIEYDEPACIQVTCDEVKTNGKSNCNAFKTSTKNYFNLKGDLQEWLAKPSIIECSEWSKSIQGPDIKTESAPELEVVSSKSSLSVPKCYMSNIVK